jgi:hypothetical protein
VRGDAGTRLDPAKVNPNGSGISLGHPIGATGALITVKALYELKRIGGRYALVTMCIGGGRALRDLREYLIIGRTAPEHTGIVMTIETVGVVGAGTMGNGIAQTAAVAGLNVVMIDVSDAALDKGLATLKGNLERLVSKDKLEAGARDAALASRRRPITRSWLRSTS